MGCSRDSDRLCRIWNKLSLYYPCTFSRGPNPSPPRETQYVMPKHRQPCACREDDWAAHGLGDVVRLLTVGRATIRLHVTRLQLGTVRCTRIHLTAAEVAVVGEAVRTAQSEQQQRRRRGAVAARKATLL